MASHRKPWHKPDISIEAQRLKSLENNLKYRKRILDLYGNKCNHCGNTDHRVLQLDHVHANGFIHLKEYGGSKGIYPNVLNGKLLKEDFQLLCANCNMIKKYENKENLPGTVRGTTKVVSLTESALSLLRRRS